MYIPQQFEVTDREKIFAFIQANAFGQLISTVEGKLFSSHIPFLIANDRKSILSHIAKSNPQWDSIKGQEVLATFQGSHDYISPSWYSSPGVPTWNYQSVHVYGNAELITETEELRNIVNQLTAEYESSLEEPWIPKYKDTMLNAIIGIKIKITEVQCKFKLSQNRSKIDQQQVIEQLEKNGSNKLSQAMKNEL